MSYANQCICCGAIIPEGLQVCPICEKTAAGKAINKKDCEYCGGYADLPEHIINGEPIGRVFDTCIMPPTNQGWHLEAGDLDIGIQFCPMCGRKLGGAE